MPTCRHEGHDCDCSHELECPCCREVTYDRDAHVCHDMAWERFTRNMTVDPKEHQP